MESRLYTTLTNTVLLQCLLFMSYGGVNANARENNSSGSTSPLNSKLFALLELSSQNTNDLDGYDLYLDVTLNGSNVGITHFKFKDGQLWASASTLKSLGFKIDAEHTNIIRLNSLTDTQVNYYARQQSVSIVAPLNLLDLKTTFISTSPQNNPKPSVSPGLLLNYNIYGNYAQHDQINLSAYNEIRAFHQMGVLSSTSLSTLNQNNKDDQLEAKNVRLDSHWSYSIPEKLISIRAGDLFTGALSWTRSTRLGGLQIGTNFNLQPYLATNPLPSFFGTATLPSAVELYINGLKQYSGEVPAGPFKIDSIPNFSGVGNAQLITTDSLGQKKVINFALYDTHRLLQPKLSDWSVELGTVRENYGNSSFDYAKDLVFSGTWRFGVNNHFTAETHAEFSNNLSNAGIGGTFLLGQTLGVLFASIAASKSQSASGSQYSTNYSWNNQNYHLNLGHTGTHGDYRDVATQFGSNTAQSSSHIATSYNTEALGTFGLSFNTTDYKHQDDTQFSTAHWSKTFGRRFNLYFNYNQDHNNSDNNSASLGLSFSLEKNAYVNSSAQYSKRNSFYVADLSIPAPSEGGLGWRAQASYSDSTEKPVGGLAEINYISPYASLQAGVSQNQKDTNINASGTGSLVFMGNGLFAARQINNGFAVVSTNGIKDVPVLLQNNLIGKTNNRGLLLVTPLSAYQNNSIAINPMNLPADTQIDQIQINATPKDRSGIFVNFDITRTRAASIILHDTNHEAIPLGSRVRLSNKQSSPTAITGFDGEVYLQNLDDHNVLNVITPHGELCHVSFDFVKKNNDIPLLGPFICQKVSQ